MIKLCPLTISARLLARYYRRGELAARPLNSDSNNFLYAIQAYCEFESNVDSRKGDPDPHSRYSGRSAKTGLEAYFIGASTWG